MTISKDSLHILIADAEPKVRSALNLLLEHNPYIGTIHQVENISELIDYLPKTCPDALFVDWGLFERSSNILPSIRFFCPQLTVVVLSGNPDNRERALSSGAHQFVSKGDPPDQLLIIIEELWNKKKPTQAINHLINS